MAGASDNTVINRTISRATSIVAGPPEPSSVSVTLRGAPGTAVPCAAATPPQSSIVASASHPIRLAVAVTARSFHGRCTRTPGARCPCRQGNGHASGPAGGICCPSLIVCCDNGLRIP